MIQNFMMEWSEKSFGAPLPESMLQVKVRLQPQELFSELVEAYLLEVNSRLQAHAADYLTKEELERYFTTLLHQRVLQVNSQQPLKSHQWYHSAAKRAAIPALYAFLLLQIGIAVDRDYGLRFIPVFEPDVDKLLTYSEFIKVSDKLAMLEKKGLVLVYGLPVETEGSLGYMATVYVSEDDSIRSHRRDHPVYGFIGAFFKNLQFEEALKDRRIIYGYASNYQFYLSELLRRQSP